MPGGNEQRLGFEHVFLAFIPSIGLQKEGYGMGAHSVRQPSGIDMIKTWSVL